MVIFKQLISGFAKGLIFFFCLVPLMFILPVSAGAEDQTSSTLESNSMSSDDDGSSKDSIANPARSTASVANSERVIVIISIISLAVISILALAITFWLYRWRRQVSGNNEIVVPETWHADMNRQENNSKIQQKRIGELETALKKLIAHSEQLQDSIESMTGTFLQLQAALDAKDKEIKRLQGGYDAEIFRRFLGRFIRVDQAIAYDLDNKNIDRDSLMQIRDILVDAFDECGLVSFEPALKVDFVKAKGVADHPKIIANDDPSLAGRIAEVREQGYRLHTGEIIKPAKVSIYEDPNSNERR